MSTKIITNNHWHQFRYRNEVPFEILKSEFDWTNEDEHHDGFFQYRGSWYHLSEFMRSTDPDLGKWDGYSGQTYFSSVLIRVSDDCEEYQIGIALS